MSRTLCSMRFFVSWSLLLLALAMGCGSDLPSSQDSRVWKHGEDDPAMGGGGGHNPDDDDEFNSGKDSGGNRRSEEYRKLKKNVEELNKKLAEKWNALKEGGNDNDKIRREIADLQKERERRQRQLRDIEHDSQGDSFRGPRLPELPPDPQLNLDPNKTAPPAPTEAPPPQSEPTIVEKILNNLFGSTPAEASPATAVGQGIRIILQGVNPQMMPNENLDPSAQDKGPQESTSWKDRVSEFIDSVGQNLGLWGPKEPPPESNRKPHQVEDPYGLGETQSRVPPETNPFDNSGSHSYGSSAEPIPTPQDTPTDKPAEGPKKTWTVINGGAPSGEDNGAPPESSDKKPPKPPDNSPAYAGAGLGYVLHQGLQQQNSDKSPSQPPTGDQGLPEVESPKPSPVTPPRTGEHTSQQPREMTPTAPTPKSGQEQHGQTHTTRPFEWENPGRRGEGRNPVTPSARPDVPPKPPEAPQPPPPEQLPPPPAQPLWSGEGESEHYQPAAWTELWYSTAWQPLASGLQEPLPGGEQEFKDSFDHLAEGEAIPDEEAVAWEKAVKGLYNSLDIRKGYDQAFPDGSVNEDGSINKEGVRSSTVVFMTNNGKRIMRNLSLAGEAHRDTGVVFSEKGFPNFERHFIFKCRIADDVAKTNSRVKHFKAATRLLKQSILDGQFSSHIFTQKQLEQIFSEDHKIKDLTWHHHEDRGWLELIPEDLHRETGHYGGHKLWQFKD